MEVLEKRNNEILKALESSDICSFLEKIYHKELK